MFDFFRKKPQPVQSEQMPIPLPELPAEKNNPVAIESLLKDGMVLCQDLVQVKMRFSSS